MAGLTHFDKDGQAHMVDVSDKPVTARTAVAEGARRPPWTSPSTNERQLARTGSGSR